MSELTLEQRVEKLESYRDLSYKLIDSLFRGIAGKSIIEILEDAVKQVEKGAQK